MPPRSAANPNFSITLILAAAIASSLFTAGVGVQLYRGTGQLIEAAKWVEHTHEVLSSLQAASQDIDRAESSSRLYLATKDDDRLTTARAAALRLETLASHLKDQVKDNHNQDANAAAFSEASASLARSLDGLPSTGILPRDPLLRCRQTINVMAQMERGLLKERSETSQAGSSRSLTIDVLFAGISLAFLLTLFAFLLRDALVRRKFARQSSRINQELAASVDALKEQALESHLLTSARDELQLCVNLEQVYLSAARSLAQLVPGSIGSLGMIDNSRHLVETVADWGRDGEPSLLPEIFAPSSCCGLRSGSLRWRREAISEVHCTHFRKEIPNSYLCIPMMAHGETIGVLFIQVPSEAVGTLLEKRLDTLRQVIQLIGMSIASLQLRLKLEHQSIRDPLTGLFNRHFMQITLEKELARCKRKRNTLGVLMLDVDHFKTFNDRFGHAAGDSVLQSVAAVLQSSIRTEDFVCRYGGEEFIIILPEIEMASAWERAENIRYLVSQIQTSFDSIPGGGVTISIGLALSSGDHTDPAQVIRKADEALYGAKNMGRNRVVLHDSVAPAEDSLALSISHA